MAGSSKAAAGTVVAVIGAGTIGASWARAFLDAGFEVRVWDPRPGFEPAVRGAAGSGASRLIFTPDVASAVSGADFVQESGPEDLALKTELFAKIAKALPDHAVLASSTSTLMPTLLQQDCAFADRLVVGHPFNPPHILPLVEVVGGKSTGEGAIEIAMATYRRAGKYPIRLHRERPGHLANRLQAALWREAVDAVASGQASVADVEVAVTMALGPRWALMGPFTTFNLGGGPGGLRHFLDHLGGVFEGLWDDLQRPDVTPALRDELVTQTARAQGGNSIEALMAHRDAALRAVLASAAAMRAAMGTAVEGSADRLVESPA